MSFDLQFVQYQDIIPMQRVGIFGGIYPTVFDLNGNDFSKVSDVLFNGIPAAEYIVLSKTRMLAQIPLKLADAPINTITVLSHSFTATEQSLLSFRFSATPRLVRGLPKLVQTFVKLLLTSPGSDIYSPTDGGNLNAANNQTGAKGADNLQVAAISTAVANAREQLTSAQAQDRNLPLSERLLSATLIGVNRKQDLLLLEARVQIVSQAGEEALATLAPESKEVA
jgi:hypothetical protein